MPRSRAFLWGLALMVVGCGPLLLIILAARLGIGDPDPNPIGPGMLAGVCFWPALLLLLIGRRRG